MIKQFSRVELTNGSVGSVMDVYDKPYEAYDVDIADPDPAVPLPADWLRTVGREMIAKVLWEPAD